jgi:DNA-binding HxlR family transcriptional regulator
LLSGKDKITRQEAGENMAVKKESLCENIAGSGCGLKKVLELIGGKWKILILCQIDNKGVGRFNDMKREISGITNTMLASSLKEMERDGMLIRRQYNEMPVRVEYMLTDKAKTLIPILLELKKWGENNMSGKNAAAGKSSTEA